MKLRLLNAWRLVGSPEVRIILGMRGDKRSQELHTKITELGNVIAYDIQVPVESFYSDDTIDLQRELSSGAAKIFQESQALIENIRSAAHLPFQWV
jgi:hypothetical protein